MDTRADVWAFGGVLYEMLTGARAFPGPTVTDTLAQILERDPDWTKIGRRGGGPVVVADLAHLTTGDLGPGWWTATGQMLLPDAEGPIRHVPASGGALEVVVPRNALQPGEFGMRFPLTLPDDSATLFVPRCPGVPGCCGNRWMAAPPPSG